MRSLVFFLLFYTSTLCADIQNYINSAVSSAVSSGVTILLIVPTFNYLKLKMHYRPASEVQLVCSMFFLSMLLNDVINLIRMALMLVEDVRDDFVTLKFVRRKKSYGFVLDSQFVNKIFSVSDSRQDCIPLLSGSTVFPYSINGRLMISVMFRNTSLEEGLIHLPSKYGSEGYSWFEMSCMSNDEVSGNRSISVFNKVILNDVCTQLREGGGGAPKNVSEYSPRVHYGKGRNSFLAINVFEDSNQACLFVFCDLKSRSIEIHSSHYDSEESALQQYITRPHEKNDEHTVIDIFYLLGFSIASGISTVIASYPADYISFVLLSEMCPICLNKILYPGVVAAGCGYHWFCITCLVPADRRCAVCRQ
ncbi:MAG: hypothetical protein ACR2PT_18015 [Endozoicomonas sp.]